MPKKRKELIQISGFSLSKGRVLTNDDSFGSASFANSSVAVVCDGVGSAEAGAEASQRTVAHMIHNLRRRPKSWSIEKTLLRSIESINSILYHESLREFERPELVTTLAIAVIEGDRLYGANVGDSRIYLLRDNTLTQLSQDQTSQEDGEEHILTQAIGIAESVTPYYFENIVKKDDIILLCSDGLYNVLDEEEIKKYLSFGATRLVKYASKKMEDNLPDDTTAVVINIQGTCELKTLKEQNLIIPQTLKKDQIIDGYHLKKSLIQNDRVWLCEKKGKSYVIKFAPIEAIDDEDALDLFVQEAWNAKRLKSPFFPRAVIPKNRTHRYYVMQYLEGVTVESMIQKQHLSVDESVELAKMLLKMALHLLKFDLVHGDIKPDNIICLNDKSFKMIDFGSIVEIFSIDSKAGTPSYLAPERFEGESISEATEIFAIGVTLYRALTGKYPYGEIEPFSNPSFKEAKKPSHYNKNIPQWLDSVILRSIAIDKEKRYEHYSEMLYEISKPEKVKPYYDPHSSIIQRDPLNFYRYAFIASALINIILFLYILQ